MLAKFLKTFTLSFVLLSASYAENSVEQDGFLGRTWNGFVRAFKELGNGFWEGMTQEFDWFSSKEPGGVDALQKFDPDDNKRLMDWYASPASAEDKVLTDEEFKYVTHGFNGPNDPQLSKGDNVSVSPKDTRTVDELRKAEEKEDYLTGAKAMVDIYNSATPDSAPLQDESDLTYEGERNISDKNMKTGNSLPE
jgi:hypothetical protein